MDNKAVLAAQTVMNVSSDSTSYQNVTAGFVYKNVIAEMVLNEGDYHGVVVVGDKESPDIRAVVCATKMCHADKANAFMSRSHS